MLELSIQQNLNNLRKSMLVVDIETSSHYPEGQEVNIRTAFEDYIQFGIVKWFGAYSYKTGKEYYLNAITDQQQIKNLLKDHNIIIGFNNEDFDWPLLVNNDFTQEKVRYNQVDVMQILGTTSGRNKNGYVYKNRAELMDIKLKKNSLASMAEAFGLETQKGSIDYSLFHKMEWTPEEVLEIKKYLSSDVLATKELFERLWVYWQPFAELVDEKNVYDLSWMKSSIASLTYKAACRVLNTEPTYSDSTTHKQEEMGGRVIEPRIEEAYGVWHVDFASLYPHILKMFNLPSEVYGVDLEHAEASGCKLFKGNDLFKVKGTYLIDEPPPICKYIGEKLKERIYLKETDPKNPMIYTLKILLNGLYGIFRSPQFEKVYTPNNGWDCCWLGQQIHELMEDMMNQFGFDMLAGDTDSGFFKARDEANNNREYVVECLSQIIEVINDNVPFPTETFQITIEHYLEYIMFPFSDEAITDEETGKNKKIGNRLVKERKGRKKNYMYMWKDKNGEIQIKLVGLPIIKDNATQLGMLIYTEALEPVIKVNMRAKFPKYEIDHTIAEYLKKPEIMQLISQEYKVQEFSSYKISKGKTEPTGIHAQVSKGYLDGLAGSVRLIKNKKVGRIGKGMKYCTVAEALEHKLSNEDLDLEKIMNELEPFILFDPTQVVEVKPVKEKKPRKAKKETVTT